MPDAAAAETFERLVGWAVPTDAVWAETQRHGERMRRQVKQQQAAVGVERVGLPPPGTDHDRSLGVSLDGASSISVAKAGRSSKPGRFTT